MLTDHRHSGSTAALHLSTGIPGRYVRLQCVCVCVCVCVFVLGGGTVGTSMVRLFPFK